MSAPHRVPALLAGLLAACLPAGAGAQLVFEPSVSTSLSSTVFNHALGDVDGDGDADLLIADVAGAPWLRLSDGSGQFGPAAPVNQPGIIGASVALADLDGDTVLDLITGSTAGLPRLWVLHGNGDGSFGTPVLVPLGVQTYVNALVLETGDADGDGDLDVAATTPKLPIAVPGSAEVRLLLNDGSGALTTALLAPDVQPQDLRRAFPVNANGDAFPDLVLVTSVTADFYSYPRMRVLTGTASGEFVITQYLPDVDVVRLADLDGDGDQDLLTTVAGGGLVQIRPGDGSGVYAPGSLTPTGFAAPFLDFADFDGDGLLDLVAVVNGSTGLAHFQHGTGLGGFPGPIVPFSIKAGTAALPRAADVDGDGRLDLVTLINNSSVAPKVGVARNRTYTAAEPLLDLGFALEGGKGFPVQVAAGQFGAGDPFSFTLHGAPANGPAYHVVGASQVFAPFKGGLLVPAPGLITGPWLADAAGRVTLAGAWPAGAPSGATLTLQFWFPDPAGVAGFAASTAVAVSL